MNLNRLQILDRRLGMTFLLAARPFVQFIAWFIRRDHTAPPQGEIVVIKMLGGGNLVIAMPALLGLRRSFPALRLTLLTTQEVRPFAEILGIFDRILVIDSQSLRRLALSAARALIQCFRADTILDLEAYSKLTTVFALLTCARNRVSFYLENTTWRRHLSTHLIFFNRFGGAFFFYDQVVRLLGAVTAPISECRDHLVLRLPPSIGREKSYRIAVGHRCSTLGRERMLSAAQWKQFFDRRTFSPGTEIHFLGGTSDNALADEIITFCRAEKPALSWFNHCNELSLPQSLGLLKEMNEFWGIDSSLHHFARLLGIPCISIWGPTSPATRLRPIPSLNETVIYRPISCSPCVHVTEVPPCRGNNLCIQGLFGAVEENPSWVTSS